MGKIYTYMQYFKVYFLIYFTIYIWNSSLVKMWSHVENMGNSFGFSVKVSVNQNIRSLNTAVLIIHLKPV